MKMSYFSEALRDLLDEHDLSALKLAQLSNRSSGSIDSYLHGRSAPRSDALADILPHFPPSDRARLLVARLRDEVPDAYADSVQLAPAFGIVEQEADAYALPEGLSSELRHAIERLARAALRRPDIRDLIIALARATLGPPEET